MAALVVGILAFLTGLIPWLGLLLGAAAVALSVVGIRQNQRRAFTTTGLILGGLAFLTGLIVTIAFTVAVASGGRAPQARPVASAPAQTASPTATPTKTPTSTPTPTASPTPTPTPAPAPSADGSVARPYPQPYTAKGFLGGEKYSLTGRIVDANANELVEGWNQFNSDAPAGFKYVVVELTMTGIDKDGVEPSLAAFDLSLATAEGNRYDNEFIVFGDGMAAMTDGPTLYPGVSFTGYTAYLVPEGAQSFLLYDNGNYVAI